ncbi:hypothetical protein AY601_1699 [Pedobacter cryoconitis]|uniref:Uncharacterized protein n=1 Tax=Pedobacter cryoconitis TaxID=188932 RepID=A0A127VB93_9SPHI|nr:hypothetical protein [Pedobacter cryoconitis]AMP98613.1 hypothetical protein AY601_1699 [Pedobacter cryoconitis]
MANSWYAYLGGDVTLTSSYRRTSVEPAFKRDGSVLSAVYLPDVEDEDGNVGSVYPAYIPSSVLDHIANALISGEAQPRPSNAAIDADSEVGAEIETYVCLR